VRLQKQGAEKAREIIPALFVDMFGDPETNLRELPVLSVGDFVKRFEGGKNLQAGSDLEGGFRILKVSAVTSGTYRETENKAAPNDYDPPRNHVVRVGDLLFSRANTKELVGATAIVESSDRRTLLPDKLWRFVWKRGIEPRYVHALFQTPHVRRELSKLSTGTSASMRNISQAKLRSLTVPVADIEEQKAFSSHAESILGISNQQERAMETSEQTFQSLLNRAFTGQL
jgi:type I restriction enzyme S subunit